MKKTTLSLLLIFSFFTSFSQEIKFGKVSKEELEEKHYPLDSTASAAYLYKYRSTYYDYTQNDGFNIITQVYERIKIYNQEGLNYANKIISYYKPENGDKQKINSIKGYTFNLENGKILKEKLSNKHIFDEKKSKFRRNKKIAMPTVKVGSIIDLKYELKSPFTKQIDDIEFQFAIPVKNYTTKIQIPEYYVFRKNIKGFYYIAPEESSSVKSINFSSKNRNPGHNTTWETSKVDYKTENNTFIATDIPALKDNEPFVGNIKNYRGGISFELSSVKFPNSIREHYATTWEDVSKKIYQYTNFGSELNKTGYFKKDLTSLIANTKNDIDKTFTIFQFIKSKIKWNGYYGKYTDSGVRKAYKEGVGNVADINLMLTSMLREAGLNANPVLVSSKNNGIPLFPTIDGFNYVISMVEFSDNSYILLDATEPLSVPNILPARALNWNGRKVTKDGSSSWVKLTPPEHSTEDNKIYAKITPENTLEGLIKTSYDNLNALNYRLKNNSLEEESILSNLEERFQIEIEDYKILNQNEIYKPISVSIKFNSDNLIEKINSKLYIHPLLFLANTENPFKSTERKFPVDFTAPWKDKSSVVISIPDGYKVDFIPETIAIGLPDDLGFFKFKAVQSGNKLSIHSLLQVNESIISPQYYQTLKEFYAKMVSKQSEKIVLVKDNS
ncbi:DUF3857 domain-containing protein [Tenacibaculum sp. IB213877]|uniref:DUF3857 domain-containing protein n=1 Tax=Tenacibaculum sp. IB213877 TaxID=3097351 RepID=UPI002A5A1960|nr:DUF3857 domain-containing protein [Tenacibaculum sp. IB213877]MDY0780769.1 DUF3857 domain-containing protein [Tenacibaculum sp. IB213877]